MTLHYEIDGTGFPIVWVHGFPLSSAMFEPQLGIAGYRHVRPDLRGFGKTPPGGEPASMRQYAEDVLGVMDSAGIDRAVIAGFSMGGYVVMEMLRIAPERFEALLLLDTRETADTPEGRAGRLKQIEEVRRDGIAPVVEAMLPKMVLTERHRHAVRTMMEASTPEGAISALQAMAERQDSSETLRGLKLPALMVVGDRDAITPPKDAERMRALIEGAELAPIAQAAHMANFERPEQLNPLIAAFLARHIGRESDASAL